MIAAKIVVVVILGFVLFESCAAHRPPMMSFGRRHRRASVAEITQYVYHNSFCEGSPYNVTTVPENTCRGGAEYSCKPGYNCIRMQTYTSLTCAGSPVAQTGTVCGICAGSDGAYLKYNCGSSLSMESCTDKECTSCTTVPLQSGCQFGIDYAVVGCSAVVLKFYGGNNCTGSEKMSSTVPGELCDAGIYWQC